MKIYTIYKATNNLNGMSYIGFDSAWPRRKKVHFNRMNKDKKEFFHNALNKYGFDNFSWEILYQSLDRDYTLKTMEEHFIREYDTFWKNGKGYNLTYGGQGVLGVIISEETRKKLSDAAKNRELTEKRIETLRKNAQIRHEIGHSEETKKKISESHKKVIHTEEWCKNNGMVRRKLFKITFADGKEEIINGMKPYCKEKKLESGKMFLLAAGRDINYRGIKVERI
mgnify:CR=1 FL=1